MHIDVFELYVHLLDSYIYGMQDAIAVLVITLYSYEVSIAS